LFVSIIFSEQTPEGKLLNIYLTNTQLLASLTIIDKDTKSIELNIPESRKPGCFINSDCYGVRKNFCVKNFFQVGSAVDTKADRAYFILENKSLRQTDGKQIHLFRLSINQQTNEMKLIDEKIILKEYAQNV
jgi:hypothetical protein